MMCILPHRRRISIALWRQLPVVAGQFLHSVANDFHQLWSVNLDRRVAFGQRLALHGGAAGRLSARLLHVFLGASDLALQCGPVS